ncbi:MAG: hypothetical protein KJ737_19665 [Proteobacteria bacterium]|nr:hypothetical protein [Pseudomonadota bacterium]
MSLNRLKWVSRFVKSFTVTLPVSLFFIIISMTDASAQRTHTVYYEGTEHELHVYRIYGKEPGKTMMLIGGIQGDEPGGFLSADLYADFALSKGNLIVVPRANFLSILQNRRQINEDMNRKFADEGEINYEAKVVTVLKKLIAESDCLLNLHDGSGFYSETYDGPMRNPTRFGQSIIADSETFTVERTGKVINLGETGRFVAAEINKNITEKDYSFHFNNHRTSAQDSIHKEQRKSATYYALTVCGIPAFGIESSKELPLELKILHHNLAINAFMKYFGIKPETPGINLDAPDFKYLVISVNNMLPVVVENQQTLCVSPGDEIAVTHIEANYERGLSADLIDYGSANDVRKKIKITKPTRIVVRKDSYPCGSVYIALTGKSGSSSNTPLSTIKSSSAGPQYLLFKVKVNQEEIIVKNYSHITIVEGDLFEIVDVLSGFSDPSALQVNFKGYVADEGYNQGEDRGFVIDTGKDLWERYSIDGKGKTYQTIVTLNDEIVGKLFIDLEKPSLNYILVKMGDEKVYVSPGETIDIDRKKTFKIVDIITDIKSGAEPQAFITGPSFHRKIEKGEVIAFNEMMNAMGKSSGPFQIEIKREKINLGKMDLRWL